MTHPQYIWTVSANLTQNGVRENQFSSQKPANYFTTALFIHKQKAERLAVERLRTIGRWQKVMRRDTQKGRITAGKSVQGRGG